MPMDDARNFVKNEENGFEQVAMGLDAMMKGLRNDTEGPEATILEGIHNGMVDYYNNRNASNEENHSAFRQLPQEQVDEMIKANGKNYREKGLPKTGCDKIQEYEKCEGAIEGCYYCAKEDRSVCVMCDVYAEMWGCFERKGFDGYWGLPTKCG